MSNLTDDELRAIAYFSIGAASEGKDAAYGLSFCGYIHHGVDGAIELEPIGNSGYTIGEMQTDLGSSDASISRALVDGFQDWAKVHYPLWTLDEEHASRLATELARDGDHVRDANYTAHNNAYKALHHNHSLSTSGKFPKAGPDIDPTVKTRLDTYLRSDPGKVFVDRQDATQVKSLLQNLRGSLTERPLYENASPPDQVKLFALMAKVYNQSPAYANRIMQGIERQQVNTLADINHQIDSYPAYMRTGRQAVLAGADVFNALQQTTTNNPLHAVWQDVLANPVDDSAPSGSDPANPHLADEYAVVKALFVQPALGIALIDALEKDGSYNHGNPASAHSRGFYAQGNDFLQWDRNGRGRAYIGGHWLAFSRDEISVVQNRDHTLDVRLTQGGAEENLLHLADTVPGEIHARGAIAGLLHSGAHGEAVVDLQNDLHQLGYLRPGDVDGYFGPLTASAVERFQRDEGLVTDGIVGDATRQKLAAGMQAREQMARGSDCAMPNALPDFSDPAVPQHAMYSHLQALLPPGTSTERLHQATAACHMAGMHDPGDLAGIHGGTSAIVFTSHSISGHAAVMDMGRPAPSVQQTLRQVQAFDQRQDQRVGQRFQPDPAQPQGPVLGGL